MLPIYFGQTDPAAQPGPSHSHQSAAVSIKKHMCDVCHRKFARADQLRRHKLTHRDQKDHVCDDCGKAFTLAQTLKQHKLIHTGQERERNHACDVCSKVFSIYFFIFYLSTVNLGI
jgi:KRAB domain-containing zinc finger protein